MKRDLFYIFRSTVPPPGKRLGRFHLPSLPVFDALLGLIGRFVLVSHVSIQIFPYRTDQPYLVVCIEMDHLCIGGIGDEGCVS